MKKFLLILILTLSFHSYINADNAEDFQIEGVSVGDSLLDHYSEDLIKTYTFKDVYPENKYLSFRFLSNSNVYGSLDFIYKKGDAKYKIYSISGKIFADLDPCLEKKENLTKEYSKSAPNAKIIKHVKKQHPDFEGLFKYSTDFKFKQGGAVQIACYDYSDELTKQKSWRDIFVISIDSEEFYNYLENLSNKKL